MTVMLDRGPRRRRQDVDGRRASDPGRRQHVAAVRGAGRMRGVARACCWRAGANANDAAADGKSALVMAAFSGHTDVARHAVVGWRRSERGGRRVYGAARCRAAWRSAARSRRCLRRAPTRTRRSPREPGATFRLAVGAAHAIRRRHATVVAAAYLETGIIGRCWPPALSAEARLPNGTSALPSPLATSSRKRPAPQTSRKWNIVDSDTPEVPRAGGRCARCGPDPARWRR